MPRRKNLIGHSPKSIPKKVNSGSAKDRLVYIGNARGDTSTIFSVGANLRYYDVFKRVQNKYYDGSLVLNDNSEKVKSKDIHSNNKYKPQSPRKKRKMYFMVLRRGVTVGDVFLKYGTGAYLIIRERQDGGGYWLSPANVLEREAVQDGYRHARRNLRWEYKSFCYLKPSKQP